MPPYPGAAQAQLLRDNSQVWAFGGPGTTETVVNGEASVGFELDRKPQPRYYPWGMAAEVRFSGAPGVFEIDVQVADVDDPAHYVTIAVINAVNASNVGRADLTSATPFFARYARLYVNALANAVGVAGLLTR